MVLTRVRSDAERALLSTRHGVANRRWITVAVLVSWGIVIVSARWWGFALRDAGRVIRLDAAPLVGVDDIRIGWRVAIPIATSALLVFVLPHVAQRARMGVVFLASGVSSGVFALSLALVDGWEGVLGPLVRRGDEYLLDVPRVGSPGAFLSNFAENIDAYVTHVRSHPPGFVLLLWGMDRIGLGGRPPAAGLCVVGGMLAVVAVLVAVREIAGPATTRAAAPFVALAPVALWVATTADAFFAGVGAWAVTSIILATGRRDRVGDVLALGGGVLFGVALMLSYGLVLLAAVPLAVAIARRRVRPLVLAAVGAAVVFALCWTAGFSWWVGLEATRHQYAASVARTRPYGYFLLADAAAFAIALGPATAVALAGLRDRRLWLLVGGALAAVVLAAVSGMSKGEVERIWLPFSVWVLTAGACLATRGAAASSVARRTLLDRSPPWLAAQVTTAIVVQTMVRTHW